MGFFSSRKADDDSHAHSTHVIRSRFYGKSKGKQRARDIVPPAPLDVNIPGPSSQPVTPRKTPTTDTVTLTLAQRLNELAAANAQGLLDDDEYRLLRQDLFDRLGKSSVPVESPVVPISTPRHAHKTSQSHFHIDPTSPSIRSKSSARSGVTSLLMRVTSTRTRSGSQSTMDDGTSVVSSNSGFFKRALGRKSSVSSVRTSASSPSFLSPHPVGSSGASSAPETPTRHRSGSEAPKSLRAGSKSHGSIRMLATPPSAYHHTSTHSLAAETPARTTALTFAELESDETERLITSAEIQSAIASIEAERKRLVDAFNSLEISALTKHGTPRPTTTVVTDPDEFGGWPSTPSKRTLGGDVDALSLKSGVSAARSTYSATAKGRIGFSSSTNGLTIAAYPSPARSRSRGPSLSRQTSQTSLTSTSTRATRNPPALNGLNLPPVPPLPKSQSSLHLSSPLGALAEQGEMASEYPSSIRNVDDDKDRQLAELKKRRVEVLRRYDDKIEYLRAKLKGAELREKLMRR